jgi:hypothetical protein
VESAVIAILYFHDPVFAALSMQVMLLPLALGQLISFWGLPARGVGV